MPNGTGWREQYLDRCRTEDEEREMVFKGFHDKIQEVIRHCAVVNRGNKRGLHAKCLAGIKNAIFRISPKEALSKDLRFGFLVPDERYDAVVRFSNASSNIVVGNEPDADTKDLRGVAISVQTKMGDHDFLMTNAEPHHAKDAKEAMAAIVASAVGLADFPRFLLDVGALEVLRMAFAVKNQMARPVESLATETFWSRAPIAIGEDPNDPNKSIAVKYRLKPVLDKPQHPRPAPDLGEELTLRLQQRPLLFLFQVQRFVDEHTTPIEIANVEWDSEYETIAELLIPQQELKDADQQLVDNRVFNPWNVDERFFRPLGSMNRVRKVVYPASVELRPHS